MKSLDRRRRFFKPATHTLLISVFVMVPLSGFSQTVLDGYIEEALQSNRALQVKNISRAQAENALRIAKSYFLPSISLLGDYTSGKGGRSIGLPLGDLLNPVYRSLNELAADDNFSEISNMTENFFPHNFYDVRLRTSLPILDT